MKLFSSRQAFFGAGMGMGGPRKPLSLISGFLFLALGLIPLLKSWGVIGFNLPVSPVGIFLWILATVAGIILLWDAIGENMAVMGMQQQVRIATLIIGLAMLAIGLIPILHSFGAIGFNIPPIADTIKNILFAIVGFLLIYGGTQGF